MSDTIVVNDVTYLKGINYLKHEKIYLFYMIPQKKLTQFSLDITEVIVILCGIIINAILFFVLFLINRMATHKFHILKNGMDHVGKNQLSYRIPVGKYDDEFAQIAIRFNKMCDELQDMIDKNYVYQMLQQNAEYRALQASVNPHFLYNSLEAIREKLVMSGQESEASMILMLSRMFEYQIRGSSIVNIYREMNALQNYIDFSSIRYQYSFDYSIDFDKKILGYIIPKQIFQPIMENYFVHGYRGDGMDYITITGYEDAENGKIYVRFRDNGKGMTEEKIEKLNLLLDEDEEEGTHIGLRNVHKRLKIACGKESGVLIASNGSDAGVTISLVFCKVSI